MITEAYIKGRCDFGVGKYAVVIVEKGEIVHQVAYKVGEEFTFNGAMYKADQYNCEIVAACYACDWCKRTARELLNIYANTNTCQKWYYRREFPDGRELGKVFSEYADGIQVYADFIAKNSDNEFNVLVNRLAEECK